MEILKKKYHWYSYRFIYKKNNNRIFDFECKVGIKKRSMLVDDRLIKESIKPLHLSSFKTIKHLLCNGNLIVEPICYLGKFAK